MALDKGILGPCETAFVVQHYLEVVRPRLQKEIDAALYKKRTAKPFKNLASHSIPIDSAK